MWHRWQRALRFLGGLLVGSWSRCAVASTTRVQLSADGEAIPHDQAGQGPPAPVDPPAARLVPPSSVAEVLNVLAVRPVALLASAAGPLEPDLGRQLRPVDWVEIAELVTDRHQESPTACSAAILRRTFATVALLHWNASCTCCQDEPPRSMAAIPSLRFQSSGRPL